MLYAWPASTQLDQTVPKARILAQAGATRRLKEKLTQQVERLSWAHKLSPETLNLSASTEVAELQVFKLQLKAGVKRVDSLLLRAIDQSIPSPLLFELQAASGQCLAAAYKRPNESDPSRWVLGEYLIGPWQSMDAPRQPLPVALDLGGLYGALLRGLMPLPARSGESLRAHLERLAQLRVAEREEARLQRLLTREAQFNRKLDLNRRLRDCRENLDQLRRVGGPD